MAKNLKAGNLVAKVKAEGIEQFDNDMKKAGGSATSFGGIVGAAAVAVGAAMVGIAKGAIDARKEYKEFEASMAEVKTLLPDITNEAFGQMTNDVKDFSMEFGVLSEEVVPALYQSISAGVPKDNVFDFLETAQKAATASATDLETAVDGITSVVNAYGEETVNAERASDIMFGAVLGGKTTFEELSSSLFNVVPKAVVAGVAFEDVSAAMATLTSGGTPTAQATTQMRAALDELSKDTSKASQAFEQMSGKSFRDFVKGGGTMTEALEILKEAADEANVDVDKLFASTEAGSAIAVLAGEGFDKFSESADNARESIGATQQAYDTYVEETGLFDQKVAAAWDNIKKNIGESVDNIFVSFNNASGGKLLELIERFESFTRNLADSGAITDALKAQWEDFMGSFTGQQISALVDDLKNLWSVVKNELLPALGGDGGINEEFKKFVTFMLETNLRGIVGAFRAITWALTGLAKMITWAKTTFDELKERFMQSQFVKTLTELFNNLKQKIDENSDTIEAIIEFGQALGELIKNVLIAAVQSWIDNWNTLKEKAGQAWTWITEKAQDFYNWVEENMPWVIDNVEMLKTIAVEIKDSWVENFNKIKDIILGILPSINQVTATIMGINRSLTQGGGVVDNTVGYMRAMRGRQGGGKTVRQFATGGSNIPGGPAMVGENGPELVYQPSRVDLPSNATVLNADQTAALIGGGGSSSVVVNNYVNQAHFTDNAQINQWGRKTGAYASFGSIA